MMNKYIDFCDYLQKELNDDYYVGNERILDSFTNKINVVVKALSGNIYDDSATIPYQIEIYTDNPEKVMLDFSNFAEKHNNKPFISIVEGDNDEYRMYNVIGFYTTPTIMESDIDYLDNHYARIVVFASLFIMFDLVNISDIIIDGEKIESLNGTISYATEVHGHRRSGYETNRQVKTASSVTITFSMMNKNSLFNKKLSQIRKGEISGNTIFDVNLKLTDNTNENYKMIVTTSTLTFARSALPSVNVALMEADDNAIS